MINLVTRKDVFKHLHINYQTLRNMVLRNDIQTVKLGNKYLYNFDKYLSYNNIKIPSNSYLKLMCVIVVYQVENSLEIYRDK